jgi:hypothetical protein
VRDNGPGIAPDAQEAIFQEFVQLDNPERNRAKGSASAWPSCAASPTCCPTG